MYRCHTCNINFASTRQLYSHQFSEEHKRQQSLNSNHTHSISGEFSNGQVGVGKAGGGLEISRAVVASTGVSVNQSMTTQAYRTNAFGTEVAGPSTSMLNRFKKPQQGLNQATGPRGTNISSQSNQSSLADGGKASTRKNPGSSGATGGRFVARGASVMSPNLQRTTGAHIINQPAGAPAILQQYRRVSSTSRTPAQKGSETARERSERTKSVQREIHLPNAPKPCTSGTPAHLIRTKITKSFNKEVPNQSANPPLSPVKLNETKVGMTIKGVQTQKKEPQQKEKIWGLRERFVLPPKKSVQSVAASKAEGGGKGGRTPPKKNIERNNRFISNPISAKRAGGVAIHQTFGKGAIPSTISVMGKNTKSASVGAAVNGTGRGGDVVTSATVSPCAAREISFKATSQNTSSNLASGLDPIQNSKTRQGGESGPRQPTKDISMRVDPTTPSANQNGIKSNAGGGTSAARHGGKIVSKILAKPAASKAREVPEKDIAQKKNSKPDNSFKAIQTSDENGQGAQSCQKGESTKLLPEEAVQSKSSHPATAGNKKASVTMVSAAPGNVGLKAVAALNPSKTRGIRGTVLPQKKTPTLAKRCNPKRSSSKKNEGVAHFPNLRSTKRSSGAVGSWLSAADRRSEVAARKSTVTATTAKRITEPKLVKVRKGVKKVNAKQLKDYVSSMPGRDYEMPLMTGIGSYTNEKGKKLWVCLVCNKNEPMKSSKPMVCCEICEDWYHFKCVGIKEKMPKKDPWYCKRCIYLSTGKKN